MGRRVINDFDEELKKIEESGLSSDGYHTLKKSLKDYYEVGNQVKSFKKLQDSLNKDIKELMMTENVDQVVIDGYEARVSTICSTSFDQDILLAIVKELGRNDLIKTKEYVNEEDIERLVYKGDINAESLIPAQILKESVRLNVRKSK